MNPKHLDRREFLRTSVKGGAALVLASTLPVQVAQAKDNFCSSVLCLEDLSIRKMVEFGLGGMWVAGRYISAFARNLNPANMDPALLKYLRYAGGEYKTFSEAIRLWRQIPAQVRTAGPDAVTKFLLDKEWSHIVPKSKGGATTAANGIWERIELNRGRGDAVMTPGEYNSALQIMRSEAVKIALKVTLKGMVKGAVVGIIMAATLSCLESGLLYARGEITRDELTHRIVDSSILAGATSFIVAGLMIGLAMLFPPLILAVAPAMLPLQIVSFLFLGYRFTALGKSWYDYLIQQDFGGNFCRVLKSADRILSETLDEVRDGFWGYLEKLIDWVEERPLYKSMRSLFPGGRDDEQAPRIEGVHPNFGVVQSSGLSIPV